MKKNEFGISPFERKKRNFFRIIKITLIMFFTCFMQVYSQAQQQTVTGKIIDTGGQPLPGVSVVIKGTVQGTISNADGNYSLPNVPGNATLRFTFVGMLSQDIAVNNQTTIYNAKLNLA